MKIAEKNELQDLEWLVLNRSRNQKSTLDLYKLMDREKDQLGKSRRDRAFAHCLLGICFSLWRAVFLANIKQSKGALLTDAKKFLKELIETNNISFQTDLRSNDWSFRYYTQNARDRLKYLNGSFKIRNLSFTLPGEPVGRTAQEWWESHQDSLELAVTTFEVFLQQNREKRERDARSSKRKKL